MIKTTLTLVVILFAVSSVAASEICVVREEDNGVINIRPAQITIDGRAAFAIVGGERKCQKVVPGKHKLVAHSPNPYDPHDKNQKTWESQSLKVTVPKRGKVGIAAAPISRGPEYIGLWELKEIKSNLRHDRP